MDVHLFKHWFFLPKVYKPQDIASAVMLEKMIALVERAGGIVQERLFVVKPGCMILAESQITPEAQGVFDCFNVDTSRPQYEQLAEWNSRLTYLSFPKEKKSADAFNKRMAREFQHLSVHAPWTVTFLLAGVCVETSHELCAHGEARVARLTTSKTKAMNATLYRIQGTPEERECQKAYIRQQLTTREQFEQAHQPRATENGNELWNMTNCGSKATVLTYTMSLKDFHKFFIGRLNPAGNELEVQETCRLMCERLHDRYPLVIRTPDEYMGVNNGEKYRS